jgi:hypothetical protein
MPALQHGGDAGGAQLRVIREVLGEPRQCGGIRIGGEDGMDIGGVSGVSSSAARSK